MDKSNDAVLMPIRDARAAHKAMLAFRRDNGNGSDPRVRVAVDLVAERVQTSRSLSLGTVSFSPAEMMDISDAAWQMRRAHIEKEKPVPLKYLRGRRAARRQMAQSRLQRMHP